MTSPIHIVGIGLDGIAGLSQTVQNIISRATVLVGSDRHLSYFPHHPAQRLVLGSNFSITIDTLKQLLQNDDAVPNASSVTPTDQGNDSSGTIASPMSIVILTSGDPLFFGLGRLLLHAFSSDHLTFHPHLSSIQLAFNRIKHPWHDATVISLHGREPDALIPALRQGKEKIALLTDGQNTPRAIAHLIQSLHLPSSYRLWVCENLGGSDERVRSFILGDFVDPGELIEAEPFAALTVVILIREATQSDLDVTQVPLLGIADECFASFSDRPGLMTKREVRTLILSELTLLPHQVIWDIGAGTGSVSIEIARFNPTATIYAIEKTSMGHTLIQTNCQRFQVNNVIPIHGSFVDIHPQLPSPDRIFIGGSGGDLPTILDVCSATINCNGMIVSAIATLEHQSAILQWVNAQNRSNHPSHRQWDWHLLSAQLSRSIPLRSLTRLTPLNPVTLIVLKPQA